MIRMDLEKSQMAKEASKVLEVIKRLQRVVMIIKLLVDQVNYWKESNIQR